MCRGEFCACGLKEIWSSVRFNKCLQVGGGPFFACNLMQEATGSKWREGRHEEIENKSCSCIVVQLYRFDSTQGRDSQHNNPEMRRD